MRKFALILISLVLFTVQVQAEELSEQKKQAIDELLEITGVTKVGLMMGDQIAAQMISTMKKLKPNTDPRAFEIMKTEVLAVVHKEFIENKAMNNLSYPIYHKHLMLSEIQGLVSFYKTPLGRKTITVMPIMTQEAMTAGANIGKSLGPVIQKRVMAALQREGIELQ